MARYNVSYDERAVVELESLRRFDQVRILAMIERHLFDQPTLVSSRSIKRLEPPVLSAYRLRVGDYRVFYDVHEDRHLVHIVAIRHKGTRTLNEAANDPSN